MKEVNHVSGLEEVNSEDEVLDPLSPENAVGLSLIVQMRIYDALLALLRDADPSTAENLVKLHASGGLLGPMPYINPESFN